MFPLTFVIVLALCLAVSQGQASSPPALGTQPEVDLRPRFEQWKLDVKRQGARGTCSVFAVTGGMEFALSSARGRGIRLSEEFLNWAKNQATNKHQDGDFFDQIWKGYEQYGICEGPLVPYAESYHPDLQPGHEALANASSLRETPLSWHWIKEWDVHTGLTAEQLEKIKETLRHGWPVCGGLRWPKAATYSEGVLDLCPPEEVFDGHSVLLVGYHDQDSSPGGGVFIIRDSGSGNCRFMPYAYAASYMNDAGWIEPVK